MPGTVLTELESACRAAHQQVQMLKDLYKHLAERENPRAVVSVDIEQRIRELASFEDTLSRKLEQQELLPMRPDPEKEGLLELFTDVKAAFSGDERPAADDRLTVEEGELLQLTEQILKHDDDDAVAEACSRIRDAIARLAATEPGTGR
jgi:hypothetical protein